MTRTIFIAATLALAVTLPSVSAQAQAIRTYVSTTGNDSNQCTITAPCRHFSAAVAATAVGGEVDALDPGGYGSFTISQGITIEGQGWSYVAPPDSGNAITINATSGNVTIHGVSINGVGTTGGTNGIAISVTSSATITLSGLIIEGGGASAHGIYLTSNNATENLNIIDTTVRDFTNSGIAIQPVGNSTDMKVFISHSYSIGNGQDGIKITSNAIGGAAVVFYVIDHTTVSGNSANGFDLESIYQGDVATGSIDQSVSSLNHGDGIYVNGNVASIISNCALLNNSAAGLSVNGGSNAQLSGSSFGDNPADVVTDNNGSNVTSYGNNAFSLYNGNITQTSLR
jgi:hypothetical protein